MTIANYAELKTEISSYLWDRSDLTARIPTFIRLAEAQMFRRLRVRRMIARSDLLLASEFTALPEDFGGMRALELDDENATRVTVLPGTDALLSLKTQCAPQTGTPRTCAIAGEELQVFPVPDAEVAAVLHYWRKIPALSDASTSNWLLEDHPDAYLCGALLQSAPWLRDDQRIAVWGALFQSILDDISANQAWEADGVNLGMAARVTV